MSTPILPFAVWQSGTNQNSIPANDNSLRNQIINGLVIGTSNNGAGGTSGDIYIVGSSPSGAFAAFDEFDLAIFIGGNWYAFAPVAGICVNIAGALHQWNGSAYVAVTAGGSDRSTVSALATSGSVAVDYALGDYFTMALSGNVSGFTFTNLPGAGKGATLMIRITQDSTPRTVAWAPSFKWAEGVPAAVSAGAGAVDVLAITTFDNGTTWYATLAKAFV